MPITCGLYTYLCGNNTEKVTTKQLERSLATIANASSGCTKPLRPRCRQPLALGALVYVKAELVSEPLGSRLETTNAYRKPDGEPRGLSHPDRHFSMMAPLRS